MNLRETINSIVSKLQKRKLLFVLQRSGTLLQGRVETGHMLSWLDLSS